LFEFALVSVVTLGLWIMALREYLSGRRRNWPVFLLGTIPVLTAVSLAAYGLAVGFGRPGHLAVGFAVLLVFFWSFLVGPR
jgi:hypothetical protein